MAANLDYADNGEARMAFVGARSKVWHGQGQEVSQEHSYDISAFLTASHLDTPVGLKALRTVDGQEIAEKYTYCKQTGKLFGCVGPRYVPLQNSEAFDFFQPWLETREVSLTTAGALFGGKKVWVQAKVENASFEVRDGDSVQSYVMLSNSHDGTTAVRVGLTPQRIVCSNTLSMAHGNKNSQLIRVRHGKSIITNLENIRETIDLVRQEFTATAEQYRKIAVRGICPADLRKFVKTAFGEENTPDDDLSTRMKNIMDEVFQQFDKERPIAGETVWNAYNAVNYYWNHSYGRNMSSRLDSLYFGVNGGKDKNMLDLALTLAS
jgi:phage/plasmid-like protein (TIGR03299 family)